MKFSSKVSLVVMIFAVALVSLAGNAFAVCGAATRTTIDSITCEDAARATSYTVDVNEMCGTYSGTEMPVVELVEKRPGQENVRASIFKGKVAQMITDAKGAAEIELFKQRAGEAGSIEGYAIPGEDKMSVQAVKIRIVPNGGETCEKTVDVSGVWGKTWN